MKTPWPWKLSEDGVAVVGKDDTPVYYTDKEDRQVETHSQLVALVYGYEGDYHSNQNLVVAAPELLEAAKELLFQLGLNDGTILSSDNACMNLRAAIAKAERVNPKEVS
jgi:hypothetical protein